MIPLKQKKILVRKPKIFRILTLVGLAPGPLSRETSAVTAVPELLLSMNETFVLYVYKVLYHKKDSRVLFRATKIL